MPGKKSPLPAIDPLFADGKLRQAIDPVEMRRLIPLKEAARLRGVSVDTMRRNMRDKIVRLSPGRDGMRVSDALDLSTD